jgi:hypothetical protein
MNQTIGYDRKELEATMRYILSNVEQLDFNVRMMEEQGLGLRDNMDWRYEAGSLRMALENLKQGLDRLGVLPVSHESFGVRENYEQNYLPKVVEEYCKHHYEDGDDIL